VLGFYSEVLAENLYQVIKSRKFLSFSIGKRSLQSRDGLWTWSGIFFLDRQNLAQNGCQLKTLQAAFKPLTHLDGSVPLKPALFHLCGQMALLRLSGEDSIFVIEGWWFFWHWHHRRWLAVM